MSEPLTITGGIVYTENVAYIFDDYGIPNDVTVNMPSQITNNYVESNVTIQDHWALPPITITMSGLIGEVIFQNTSIFQDLIENIQSKLTPITALMPSVSNITQAAINATRYIEASVNRYKNIYQSIKNFGAESVVVTNQELVKNKLEQLRQAREFVDIATPYGNYEKYAISNISIRQDATTKYISTLEVSLQQWLETETILTKPDTAKYADRTAVQTAVESNNGKAQGRAVSLAKDAFDNWGITTPGSGIRR